MGFDVEKYRIKCSSEQTIRFTSAMANFMSFDNYIGFDCERYYKQDRYYVVYKLDKNNNASLIGQIDKSSLTVLGFYIYNGQPYYYVMVNSIYHIYDSNGNDIYTENERKRFIGFYTYGGNIYACTTTDIYYMDNPSNPTFTHKFTFTSSRVQWLQVLGKYLITTYKDGNNITSFTNIIDLDIVYTDSVGDFYPSNITLSTQFIPIIGNDDTNDLYSPTWSTGSNLIAEFPDIDTSKYSIDSTDYVFYFRQQSGGDKGYLHGDWSFISFISNSRQNSYINTFLLGTSGAILAPTYIHSGTKYQRPKVGTTPMIYMDFNSMTTYPATIEYNYEYMRGDSGNMCAMYTNNEVIIDNGNPAVYYFRNPLNLPFVKPPDGGDTSGTGGGDGEYDDGSDVIVPPELPTVSARTSAMVGMYNPTMDEMRELALFMWTPSFLEGFVRFIDDPVDAIISINLLPVTPPRGIRGKIGIGLVDTGIEMYTVRDQYMTLDCGTIEIKKYWGSFMDYDPYTQIQIYLPFIGMQTLNTDDVMGGLLNVYYNIDVMTGNAVCFVRVIRDNLDSVLYSYSCNIATQLPITSRSYDSIYQACVTSTTTAITGAIGLAGAGASASASARALPPSTPLIYNPSTSNAQMYQNMATAGQSIVSSAGDVVSSKRPSTRVGSTGGSGGVLGIKKPYVVITRPIQSIPENFKKYNGFPSNITRKLSDVTGYTEVENIRLTGLNNATADEKNMLLKILNGGVIL